MITHETTAVPIADVVRAGTTALRRLGAPPDVAALVVDQLLAAELDGAPSHGLIRIAEYGKAITRGQLVPGAVPLVSHVSGVATRIDGNLAFGAVVARELAEVASSRTLTGGIGVFGVRRSGHLGRLGPIGRKISAAGRIVLGFVNSGGGARKVAPFGGGEGRFATNPILFACPVAGQDPIVVDMTTAAASDGTVQVAAARGETLPEGVLIDAQGQPVRDPARLNAVPRTAFLAPLGGPSGGHKGFALALVVEILAGALGGSDVVRPGNESMGNCGFFVVLDPAILGRSSADVLADVGTLAEYISSCAPQGGLRVRLPGHRPVHEDRNDVPLASRTWHTIRTMAGDLG
jgi:LDH2 family malate/lactate/ureidoglycolate dehydrogenase